MSGERGFTLVEMVITVAIACMLALGALWLFGLHPVALRTAVDGFDQRYGEARALAAKTGNGATIVFAPRANNAPGFVMSVYAGRPKDAASVSAMQLDDLSAVMSDAMISGPFGAPPFAIFLSSAGKPSGKAAYPSIDGAGGVSFPAIAQQPSCPDQTNGIVLTFRAPNGATDTRSIGCDGNVMVSGNAAPQPSMTPEELRIDKQSMLAHWTSDTGPLHFRVGEFGYTHWFASGSVADDARCGDSFDSDDGGAPPVVFAAAWPYQTSSPAEMNAAPAPPSVPYTWAVQQTGVPPDEPPGAFSLSPVHLNGGQCTVKIVDDYGQAVTTSAHVMGDLLVTVASPKLKGGYPSYTMSLMTTDPAQQITTGKTFDNEAIALAIGGACGGIVSKSVGSSSAGDNAHLPSLAQFTLAPVNPGTCVAHVTDQYGEPGFDINVSVKRPLAFKTWPAYLELGENGAAVGTSGGFSCYAYALTGPGGSPDTSAPQATLNALNVAIAPDGCLVNTSGTAAWDDGSGNKGVMVAYESDGSNVGSFSDTPQGCSMKESAFYPNLGRSVVQAAQPVQGAAPGDCVVTFSDGQSTQAPVTDAGLVNVHVACGAGKTSIGGSCYEVFYTQVLCAYYDFYSGAAGDACAPLITPAQANSTYSVGYYYAPPGAEGSEIIYQCADDGQDTFTGNQGQWIQFAHRFTDFATPTDEFGGTIGVANGVYNQTVTTGWNGNQNTADLSVADEANAKPMPVTLIKHVGPAKCGVNGPPVH